MGGEVEEEGREDGVEVEEGVTDGEGEDKMVRKGKREGLEVGVVDEREESFSVGERVSSKRGSIL